MTTVTKKRPSKLNIVLSIYVAFLTLSNFCLFVLFPISYAIMMWTMFASVQVILHYAWLWWRVSLFGGENCQSLWFAVIINLKINLNSCTQKIFDSIFFNVISKDLEQSWLCNRWAWKWIRLIRIANKETMISCIKKKLKWLNHPCKFTCFWFSSVYLLLLQYKPCKF